MILDSPQSTTNSPNVEFEKFVNHDLSVQLDSSNAFEGPEKLLEIWFAPSPNSIHHDGLRSVDRSIWESMLDIVKCKVLSTISTSNLDAFLLSESSMFVFPHKLILKTCGTTTTLIGIPRILEIAASVGFTDPQPFRVFYSRKSFMFPEMQLHPHRSWDDEVAFLDEYFSNGSSYMVGNMNSDHWHLYTTSPNNNLSLPSSSSSSEDCLEDDETFEILMTDLDPKAASKFFTKRHAGAEKLNYEDDICGLSDMESSSSLESQDEELDEDPGHDLGAFVTTHAGVDKIYSFGKSGYHIKQSIDSFGFTPCGYSCNALVGDSNYFTIHVTPEAGFSYASFETNVPATRLGISNAEVLERVISIFRPGKFSFTFFEAHSNQTSSFKSRNKLFAGLEGYKRTDRILYEFDGYDLIFMSYKAIV